MIGAHL